MLIQRETNRGFVSLLSLTGGVDYKGVPFPAKHTLCVAEYGVGINHYDLIRSDFVDVLLILRKEPTPTPNADGEK